MDPKCFVQKDANPPIYGVHGIALIEEKIPLDWNAPSGPSITCYVCKVSGQVAGDEPKQS